ncbi:hypothetical protein VIBNIPon4_590027 [Vibrio nigripulchritudo POn4]|nr:hypothetical protein VIBNIPon4_590027 [Vibrio nigripulchritudo POn4]
MFEPLLSLYTSSLIFNNFIVHKTECDLITVKTYRYQVAMTSEKH